MRDCKTLGFVLIYIAVECMFTCVESCSFGGETEDIRDKFYHSDVVIYGEVRFKHPPPLSRVKYYTATVNVFCTLKGPTQNRLLNISDAGSIGGRCYDVILNEGMKYIIFLNGRSNLIPAYETTLASVTVLNEISSLCSYTGGNTPPNVYLPIIECPLRKYNPDCYSDIPTTTSTTTSTIPPTAEEKYIPNDHSSINEIDNTAGDKEKTGRVVAASHSAGSSAARIATMTLWIPLFFQMLSSYS